MWQGSKVGVDIYRLDVLMNLPKSVPLNSIFFGGNSFFEQSLKSNWFLESLLN